MDTKKAAFKIHETLEGASVRYDSANIGTGHEQVRLAVSCPEPFKLQFALTECARTPERIGDPLDSQVEAASILEVISDQNGLVFLGADVKQPDQLLITVGCPQAYELCAALRDLFNVE